MDAEVPVYTIDPVTDAKYSSHTYKPSLEYNRLMNIFATLKLPNLVIKQEYVGLVEICFTKSLMPNITPIATLKIPMENGEFQQTLKTLFFDMYRARDVLNIQNWDYMIGNRPELIEWSSELITEEELALPLPFFIDGATSLSIPIHLFREHSSISVKMTNCVRLQNFLRMRVMSSDGTWVNIKPCLDFLETVPEETSFQPKVWARYRNVAKQEVMQEKAGFEIKITDYRYFEPQIVNKTFSVRLTDDKTCVRGIRFGFLNIKSAYFNDLSNYSYSHIESILTPLESFSLSNGNLFRIKQRSSIHITAISNHYSLISNCKEGNTIHDILFDFSLYSTKSDTSIIMKQESILAGTLRTVEDSKLTSVEKKTIFRALSNLSPKENISRILEHHVKTTPERMRNNDISTLFELRGYCRVIKCLKFNVGCITVMDQ